jgi:hypothetical protein
MIKNHLTLLSIKMHGTVCGFSAVTAISLLEEKPQHSIDASQLILGLFFIIHTSNALGVGVGRFCNID